MGTRAEANVADVSVTRIVRATVWTGLSDRVGSIICTDAVAFSEDGIIALGEAAKRLSVDEQIDGDRGFVIPAFGDGHVHCIQGGLQPEFAQLQDEQSVDDVVAAVRKWASAHPETAWIRGDGFDLSLAADGVFRADWLDRVDATRPIVLRASDCHTYWVNSEALRRVGYTTDTPEPHDGEIVRDDRGAPIGTLREWGAWQPVVAMIPAVTPAQGRSALARAAGEFAAAGITWVQDAWAEPRDEEVWLDAAAADVLTFRADLALRADPTRWRHQLDDFVESRARFERLAAGRISANTIKFFADGVIESGTGALLEPYHDDPHSHGLPNWEPDELARAVVAVDAIGFEPHIHAIGDAAVRSALDAIERSIVVNEARLRRPVITHAQLVDPADVGRFVELGVIVNAEPYWAMLDPCQVTLTVPRLGAERTARQYALRTLLDAGARLSFGSDWPVSTHAPLAGIQVAVTRQVDGGQPWQPEQRLTVDEALSAYTAGVAYQSGDPRAGTLRPGSHSDVVLLGANPRTVDPLAIERIPVVGTWADGTRVHGR